LQTTKINDFARKGLWFWITKEVFLQLPSNEFFSAGTLFNQMVIIIDFIHLSHQNIQYQSISTRQQQQAIGAFN
jgi:hypothetical protein